jgi:hypothetical protein
MNINTLFYNSEFMIEKFVRNKVVSVLFNISI